MMDYPLTVRTIYQRALTLFPDKPLVTRLPAGVRRTTYGEWAERVARLAGGLRDLGDGPGDRVATFCWNHDRHLEAYFAAALMGASYHTLNIRLGGDQLAYIVNHARDKVLICDAELAPAIGPVLGDLDTVQHLLVLDAEDGERPVLGFGAEHGYEDLVERSAPMTDWPELDEQQTAGICYTSATTGNPKGVAYSHRA
ncbi:MAG: AMP-binding protein, partial [Actinomycetota bacterium]